MKSSQSTQATRPARKNIAAAAAPTESPRNAFVELTAETATDNMIEAMLNYCAHAWRPGHGSDVL